MMLKVLVVAVAALVVATSVAGQEVEDMKAFQ